MEIYSLFHTVQFIVFLIAIILSSKRKFMNQQILKELCCAKADLSPYNCLVTC